LIKNSTAVTSSLNGKWYCPRFLKTLNSVKDNFIHDCIKFRFARNTKAYWDNLVFHIS
jgi:hypothetical protein